MQALMSRPRRRRASPPSDVTQQPAGREKSRGSSTSHQQGPRPKEASLFARLLRRTKSSKRQKKPSHDQYTSIPNSTGPIDSKDATASRRAPDDAPSEPVAPPQRPKTAPGFRDTATSPEPASAKTFDAPMLRKRASLRHRFRSRASSTPSSEQQIRPHTIYVPKHAASDFSRLGMSPRYRASHEEDRKLSSQLERLTPIESHPTEDDVERAETPETSVTPSRRLDEGPAVEPKEPAQENPSAQAPSRKRHSHQTPPADAELQRESPPSSVHSSLRADHSGGGAALLSTSDTEKGAQQIQQSVKTEELPAQDETQEQPSDYEQFVARAEAEERALRTQLWRISSAARPPAAARYSPPALDEIPESDNMQIPGDLSTGTTAVNRSKRDSHQLARQAGHVKRATWDSGFSASYVVQGERGSSDSPGPTYVGASSGIDYAAQQPRGLKRQSSLAKKVADYIRPPREHNTSGYEESAYRPVGSAAARGGAVRS